MKKLRVLGILGFLVFMASLVYGNWGEYRGRADRAGFNPSDYTAANNLKLKWAVQYAAAGVNNKKGISVHFLQLS